MDPEAAACMTHYPWPGNIRELQNAVSRAVILCRNNRITRDDLPAKVAGEESVAINIEEAVSRRLTIDQLEREYSRAVLASVGGNKSEAAGILGIDRKTLYRKLGEPESA
jgi:DNA-binding NtrC family response regulator